MIIVIRNHSLPGTEQPGARRGKASFQMWNRFQKPSPESTLKMYSESRFACPQ